VSGPGVRAGSLGRRATMADIGQSLATHFELPAMDYGTSFFH
jgi:phosphopentomutase